MTTLARLKQELHGTVYNRAETVLVVVAPHPLRAEKIEIELLAGLSIAEIAEQAALQTRISDLASSVVCYIDGHVVEQANWHRVRPKAGTKIVLRSVAEGPIFAGLGAIFSAISAAAASVSGFLGGLGIFGKIIGLGLAVGAQFLLNALFPVRPPQQVERDTAQQSPAYSITGSRNQAAPFEAVPVVLGSHRVTPLYAAPPYTESDGVNQWLRCLFVWGYDHMNIGDFKIGETPLTSFQDVQLETRVVLPGETPFSIYPGQVIEDQPGIELTGAGGWVIRSTAPNTNEIQLEIAFPKGVNVVSLKDGKRFPVLLQFEVQYMRAGSPNWIAAPTLNVSEQTVDVIRRTVRIPSLPTGTYAVRVRRVQPDYDNQPNAYDLQYSTQSVLTALRFLRYTTPVNFKKPVAMSAIRIRATDQLNGTLDTFNAVCMSVVQNQVIGNAWVPGSATRNPADLFRHVLQGSANARPVPNSQIDLDGLIAWANYCAANGFAYDAVLTQARSVYDTLADIASAGRAAVVFKDGKWSVVYDQQSPPVVQHFTPRNSWGFESQRTYMDMPHAWRARFINREKAFVADERIVYADGYSAANATRFEGIEFPGVTDPHNVWRHGRFHIAQLLLRPETITLNADWENIVATRGDRVRVQHDVMLIGQASGRVVAVAGQTVTLDEDLVMVAGTTYAVRFRLSDLTSTVLRTVTPSVTQETRQITLDGTGGLPAVGDLFSFGVAGVETAVYRVLGVEPNADLTARITLVDDAPGISVADQGAIPPFQSNVTAPVDPFLLPPTNLIVGQEAYDAGRAWLARINLSWTLPRIGRVSSVEIQMMNHTLVTPWRSLGRVPASQTNFVVSNVENGIYAFRVRAIFDNGTWSSWLTSENVSTTSILAPPPDVTGFKVAVIGDISTLSWNTVANAATYEIRFVPEGTEAVWNSATPLIPRASGTSAQVPTMVGSYLIKAVRGNGIRSRNATAIKTNVAGIIGLNVVETVQEVGFPGALDRLERVNGTLRLLSKNVLGNWDSLAEVVTMAEGSEGSGSNVEVEGYYRFAQIVDLSAVYTSRLTASIDAVGADLTNVIGNWSSLDSVVLLDNSEPEDWGVELQVRTTDGPPSAGNWSDWQPFVVGDMTARAFQFRLRLNGTAQIDQNFSTISPVVSGVHVSIDMPDRVEASEDIAVPTAGRRISFAPAFVALKGVAIAAQDMATGDRYAITNKDQTGFNIRFFNSSNTAVARTFDYVAKGYGQQLS